MALVKCLECGREVSSSAITCPHCGFLVAVATHTLAQIQRPPKTFWMHKRVWLGLFMFVLAGIGLLDLGKTPEQRMNEQIESRTPAVGELRAKAEAVQYAVNAPGFYDHDPVAGIMAALLCAGLGTWAIASAAKRSTARSLSAEKPGVGSQ